MNTSESAWPHSRHDLRSPAASYWQFSDLGWQRLSGLEGRTLGFRRAAEMLYESMLTSRSIADLDTVFYPYALCWRHYVELQLKALHADLRALAGRAPKATHHHMIDRLWTGVRHLIHEQFPGDEDPGESDAHRLIGQLAALDPDGQQLRYGKRRDGTASLPDVDQVNLVTFHEAMSAVANYLEAVAAAVDHDLDIKREMDEYYSAEFGSNWADFA